jgi:hypothetical protein
MDPEVEVLGQENAKHQGDQADGDNQHVENC